MRGDAAVHIEGIGRKKRDAIGRGVAIVPDLEAN